MGSGLNYDKLKDQIYQTFHESIPEAAKQAMLNTFDNKSKLSTEKAEIFGKTFDDLVSEHWATGIAGAIDYYLKSAVFSLNKIIPVPGPGTVITSPMGPCSGIITVNIQSPMNIGMPAAGTCPETIGLAGKYS